MKTAGYQQTTSGHQSMTLSHVEKRYSRLPAQQAIRVFEAAARHLSFTRASEELAMTQSGVSKQIKRLEEFLGVSLFIREGQQMSLTEPGSRFYQSCNQALECLQQAVNEIRGEIGLLRLQAPPTFAARWLIPSMAQLENTYPQLKLHIETTWLRTINDRIRVEGGEQVIHVCRQYSFDDLHCELLRKEWLVVLVSPKYLAQHGPIERAEDLIGQTLIHTRLDGHIHWQGWAREMGLSELNTEQGYEFETLDMALSAVENGIGVVIGDLFLVLDQIASGQLVIPFHMPIFEGLSYMLLSNSNYRSRGTQDSYRSWLTQSLAEDEQRLVSLLDNLGLNSRQRLQAKI